MRNAALICCVVTMLVGCNASRPTATTAPASQPIVKAIPHVPTTQLAGRPSFAKLREAYPMGTPLDVATLIGGKVKHNYDNDPLYRNTCAIRISRAFNYAGDPIQRGVAGALSNSGADKQWYIFRMADLANYLTAKYGNPVELPADVPAAALAGRRGIVAFGKLHIDLWDGREACTANYFESEKVKDPVRFWELPE